MWQSGRDGSSRLRGAARVVSGIPHYFQADFITAHEGAARADPAMLDRARTLLSAVGRSRPQTAAEWRGTALPEGIDVAGRGLKGKEQDLQILEVLRSGEITMPLWGVSLDRNVAQRYGTRFLLEALSGVAVA